MKRIRFTAIAVLALFSASAALAQSVEQNVWLRGTQIKVQNATDDHKPIVAQVGTSEYFIAPGGNYVWAINRGFFFFAAPTYLTVSAQVCDGVKYVQIVPVPAWAASSLVPQGLALSEDYISKNPSEKDLKRRIDEIKKILDKQGQVGRKEMKKELDRWFKTAKKYGFGAVVRECSSGPYALGQPVSADNLYNYNRRVVTFFVRGNAKNGYYVSWY